VFGHICAAGFQTKDKVAMKGTALGGEYTNNSQADDCMKKCDSYQVANRKKKESSQNLKKSCMELKMNKK